MCTVPLSRHRVCSVSAAPVAGTLPQLAKELQPLLGLFLQWSRCAVYDGEWGGGGGGSPEVHDHLHCFERVKLQVVKTAPDSQLLNLLSVSRLVAILDETDDCGVICELQELERDVFRGAVVGVQGEELWG